MTSGYTFSTVAVHPEREADEPIWALPVTCVRVGVEASPVLVVHVTDSAYSQKAFVPATPHPDLMHVLRVRTNRVFYAPASRLAYQ